MAREDFRFSYPLRVRWAETDMQGVVFNGHYLTYVDVGITEYFRAIGYTYPGDLHELGADLFVARATLDYHDAAVFDDMLDVCVRVGRLGNASMQWLIEIHRDQQHLISGELIYVNADARARTAVPLPQTLRDAVTGFEKVPPQTRN